MHFAAAATTTAERQLHGGGSLKRKGPEGFMRNARKQEKTYSLNLLSCLPVLSPLHHGRLAKPRLLIQYLLRFGRLKNLRRMQ